MVRNHWNQMRLKTSLKISIKNVREINQITEILANECAKGTDEIVKDLFNLNKTILGQYRLEKSSLKVLCYS